MNEIQLLDPRRDAIEYTLNSLNSLNSLDDLLLDELAPELLESLD